MTVLAVQSDVAELLDDLDVFVWDEPRPPPRDDVVVWAPVYGPAHAPEHVRDMLSIAPAVRVVQLMSAGVDPWPSMIPDGVTLCSGKTIHGGSTAEMAIALTLALIRDLPRSAEQQARHEWDRFRPNSLAGKRVLVLGTGDIGNRVIDTLETLDARVTGVSRTGEVTLDDAPALLPQTDVVIVALPLTAATTGLLDATWLAALPDGAIVVNVARGPIVDTDALVAELAAGRLRAGLDVTDPEPLPADHPLWAQPGLIITPHVGGGALGWQHRAAKLLREQVGRLDSGEQPRYVVDAGY
ncbi:NAD(P)-dependent oxidoreductase [Millisia brevis]|uniref:NAD(P)-dependent oxidoreductase n=1 Tax=Millisia brevis TaxID=264148 RepID=UPI00082E31F4|nr:NAD(P)-dependent oxidoreductase [Millisia brevis]